MQKLRVRWSLILLLVLAHPAFSAIRPSFSLDYSSWHATDIVLVVTIPVDGTFEVTESWKGNLTVGKRLVIPELRPAPNAIPISRYPQSWSGAVRGGLSELIPREPVGSRMILFLKSGADEEAPTNRTDRTERRRWKPSNLFGSMNASVVWIDGNQLYSFTQLMNPGPSVLFASRDSEARLRNRVAEINGIQENMTTAIAVKDGEERAERLKPYVRSDVFPAQQFALEELEKSGPSAVRTIVGMLDDPAFADEVSELVKALVKAGGEAVGEELHSRLRQEFAFWRSTGPSLSQGWWNEDARPHAPLRERYAQTYQLIVGLEQTHYSTALNTAVQLRDFWRSLPQLNDPSGLNQMASECDRLISQLQTN
jgi:hypothetical protein